MTKYYLRHSQVIPGPLEDIFLFFSNPRNLARLTPPWVGFKIIECPDGDVEKGSRIRYRIKLFFVPMYWETLINDCTVGVSFVDSQVKGPYKSWVHSHFFSESSGDTVIEPLIVLAISSGNIVAVNVIDASSAIISSFYLL